MWPAITTGAVPIWQQPTGRRWRLADYRNVPALEEALFILYKSYEALNMQQLSDDARRVLERSYPDSEFLTKGEKTRDEPWWKVW